LLPSGIEGYAKAEVTVGGVDTAALSSKTMEARNVETPLASDFKSLTAAESSA
jgi:predicted flavoprotein YhiN